MNAFWVVPRAVYCLVCRGVFTLVFLTAFVIYSDAQEGIFNKANANFSVVPGSVRPKSGKYPSTLPVILWKNGCQDSSNGLLDDSYTYTVFPAGAGVSVDGPVTVLGCKLTLTLKTDDSTADGFVILSIQKQKGNEKPSVVGYAALQFVDAASGLTPGDPAVDVQWVPLSRKLCNDNFGKRVGNTVLCIEVKLGNNSGHSLQLAGLGFQPTQTTLLCKTSSAPPKGSEGHPRSNTPPCASEPYNIPSVITPNVSYQSVRASLQGSDFLSAHTLLINGTQALGILMSSFTPYFRDTFNKGRWTSGVAVVGTALPGALGQVLPDQMITHLNNLDDQSLRDGKIIANNAQIRTMVFVERALFKGYGGKLYENACATLYGADSKNGKSCLKHMDDPYAERLALGKIVLVGDYVDYLQRVVVASGVESGEITPSPVIASVQAVGSKLETTYQSQGALVKTAEIIDSKGVITHLDVPANPSPNKIEFTIDPITDPANTRKLRVEFSNGKVDEKTITIK